MPVQHRCRGSAAPSNTMKPNNSDQPGSVADRDPVVVFDTMCDASNDVRAACVWLARHADSDEAAEQWWAESHAVYADRKRVPTHDIAAQLAARERCRARLRELDALIDDQK